ncbi:MAG TPA: hypothetical protein VFL14_08015 [Xanthomonadales bacterium]|nr:hypothetical protein [Xanthomonadales bacterium]
MTRALVDRADRDLAQVRAHAHALRSRLGAANPLIWLGGGVLAGAVASRIAGARRSAARPAPLSLLMGLAEGYALRALKPFLEGTNAADEEQAP